MSAIPTFQKLFGHLTWADQRTLEALRAAPAPPPRTVELFAHVLGAGHNWLARIEGRAPSAPIWPDPSLDDCERLMRDLHARWDRWLPTLTDDGLARVIHYRNSAGAEFDSRVDDILLHVCLHAQNHRGQINAALRAAGAEPHPVDYIHYARGVPAATRPSPR
ncbi:MAG TPA: DinB family protein [Gemmatimonadaceae bacterium]|nr:DinB family protein [Gemmatimonadaceae bacterium]